MMDLAGTMQEHLASSAWPAGFYFDHFAMHVGINCDQWLSGYHHLAMIVLHVLEIAPYVFCIFM